MELTRNQTSEKWIVDRVKEHLNSQPRGEGIHVSDLVHPRKAYWKRIDPRPMTDDEAGYFVAGRGHHEVIEAIIEGVDNKSPDTGQHVWEGIYYSPDLNMNYPVEIKTSRAQLGPEDTGKDPRQEYDNYLAQLTSYMAVENSEKGGLIIFYLNKKVDRNSRSTKPRFQVWDVVMTKDELAAKRTSMLDGKRNLEQAVDSHHFSELECCPSWLCKSCQWLSQCVPWETDPKRSWLTKELTDSA